MELVIDRSLAAESAPEVDVDAHSEFSHIELRGELVQTDAAELLLSAFVMRSVQRDAELIHSEVHLHYMLQHFWGLKEFQSFSLKTYAAVVDKVCNRAV